jgi:CubicO group peptidase (beta-lactamase class C family)
MRSSSRFTATVVACVLAGLASNAVAQTPAPRVDMDAALGAIAPTGPGCAASVVRPGQPVLRSARGLADLEHPEPLTPATVFETGSLAKQFTAAAVLLLVEDGRMGLDDDIRRYLPEMPDYGTPVTIRHLLNHTSGLREQWSLLALTGNPPGTQVHSQAVILDLASRQKGLNFTPGAEFLYTNTNYALAAIIIARVSGQPAAVHRPAPVRAAGHDAHPAGARISAPWFRAARPPMRRPTTASSPTCRSPTSSGTAAC